MRKIQNRMSLRQPDTKTLCNTYLVLIPRKVWSPIIFILRIAKRLSLIFFLSFLPLPIRLNLSWELLLCVRTNVLLCDSRQLQTIFWTCDLSCKGMNYTRLSNSTKDWLKESNSKVENKNKYINLSFLILVKRFWHTSIF